MKLGEWPSRKLFVAQVALTAVGCATAAAAAAAGLSDWVVVIVVVVVAVVVTPLALELARRSR